VFLVFQKVIARWVLGLEKLLLFTIRTTWLICGLGTLFLSLSRHNSTDVLANEQDRSSYDSYEVDTVSVNGFLFGCSFIHSVPVIGPVIMPALGIALGHEWAEHQTR
jgi:hypothetical protein